MFVMVERNVKLFFRDRSSVFFSLLAVFIIVGLYVLFLGEAYSSSLEGVNGAGFLINSWVMAGILSVTSVTTTMGAFGIMVDDRAKKILKDFYSSPIKRWKIAGGYVLSAFIVGVIMSLITFVIFEAYIVLAGGELLAFLSGIKLIGLILLSVFSGSSLVFFLVTFFKSQNAFATASTIIGTLIGFLTGMYIPIGNLPDAVQLLIKVFPISHAGALMRQLLLERPIAISFANAPVEVINNFKQQMGVVFQLNGTEISSLTSILILLVTGILFYGLSVINISRKSKD